MVKSNLLPSLGAGFTLIGREPGAVAMWGLVTLAAALIPTVLYFAIMGPGLMEYYQEIFRTAAQDGAEATMPEPPTSFALAGLVQLLQYLAALVSGAIVYCAVFRAVLSPEERGFARMRLSMAEVNVGVALLVLFVLMVIVMIVGVILVAVPLGIVVAVAAASDSAASALAFIPLVLLLALFGLAILFARFFIALPMSFAEQRIRVFEAWSFTKGYAGQLALMGFLQMLILAAIYIAAFAAMGLAVAGSVMGAADEIGNPAALQALFTSGEIFQRFAGAIVVIVLVYALLLFVMTPIMLAPWAKAYELIAADRVRAGAELFS